MFESGFKKKCLLNMWRFLAYPPTKKWRFCKSFAKFNGNHLSMVNIFKLHKNQTFSLIKIRKMRKIWFANNKFSLSEKVFSTINEPSKLSFLQISNDYCQKSYNGFRGFLVISATSQIFWSTHFWKWNGDPLKFFWNLHRYAFCFFIFSKWKKHYNLPFDDTFKMYCCALC